MNDQITTEASIKRRLLVYIPHFLRQYLSTHHESEEVFGVQLREEHAILLLFTPGMLRGASNTNTMTTTDLNNTITNWNFSSMYHLKHVANWICNSAVHDHTTPSSSQQTNHSSNNKKNNNRTKNINSNNDNASSSSSPWINLKPCSENPHVFDCSLNSSRAIIDNATKECSTSVHIFYYESKFIEYETESLDYFLNDVYREKPSLSPHLLQSMKIAHALYCSTKSSLGSPRQGGVNNTFHKYLRCVLYYILVVHQLLFVILSRIFQIFSFNSQKNNETKPVLVDEEIPEEQHNRSLMHDMMMKPVNRIAKKIDSVPSSNRMGALRLLHRLRIRDNTSDITNENEESNKIHNGSFTVWSHPLFRYIWPSSRIKAHIWYRIQQHTKQSKHHNSRKIFSLFTSVLIDSALAALLLVIWGKYLSLDMLVRWCTTVNLHISSWIVWLMESGNSTASPLGIKLNLQLDRTLAHMLLAGFDWWSDVCSLLYSITSAALSIITPSVVALYIRNMGCALVILCGLSFICSVLCDLLRFISLHINLFYLMSARIYQIQLGILIALWRLFRGQKRNVLRNNRIDSFSIYTTTTKQNSEDIVKAGGISIDQVILGSLLFITLALLFPTLAVFYFSLTLIKVGVNIIYLSLHACQLVFLLMPWFEIFYRVYLQKICKLTTMEVVSLEFIDSRASEESTTTLTFQVNGKRSSAYWMKAVLRTLQKHCTLLLRRHLSMRLVKKALSGERLPQL